MALMIATTTVESDDSTHSLTPQELKAKQLRKEWEKQLDLRLLQHDDLVVKLAAIERRASNSLYQNTPLDLEFSEALQEILKFKTDLSSEELIKLRHICSLVKNKNICDKGDLNDLLIKAGPNNVYSYLPKLNEAYSAADHIVIDQLIQSMSEASTAKKYYGLRIMQIKAVVADYLKVHPYPSDEHEIFLDDSIDQLMAINVNSVDLSELIKSYEHRNLVNYITMMYLIGGHHIIALNPIVETCKSYIYEEPCLKIAATMIQSDESLDVSQLGHGIKLRILKRNDLKSHRSDVLALARNYRFQTCVMGNKSNQASIYFPIFVDHMLESLEAKGEMQAFLGASVMLIDELKELGVLDSSPLGPCDEIMAMSDEAYFIKYGHDDPVIGNHLELSDP